MVDNVEQIEARLAAYIDGELTPDERVELERHLEANPSHRSLILELSAHRDLLRALPRDRAPENLSEPLEGAMERDALLGGGDPFIEFKAVRSRRWWPQLLAAAAIFILAFGLAAIVFYVLPPKHPTVAIVQPPDVDAEEFTARDRAVPQVTADLDLEERSASALTESLSQAEIPMPLQRAAGGGDSALSENADVAALTTSLLGRSLEPVATAGDTLVITITADNVQQASSELLSYFASNGIAWSEPASTEALVTLADASKPREQFARRGAVAPSVSPPPPAPNDAAAAEGRPAAVAKDTAPAAKETTAAVATDTAIADAPDEAAAEQVALGAEPSMPPPAPSRGGSEGARREVAPAVRAAAPSTDPAAAPSTAHAAGAQAGSPPAPAAQAGSAPAPAAITAGTAAGISGTNQFIVLAALDGTQAEQLATMIARPATGRRAEVRRESVTLPSAGTTAVAAGMRRQREVRVGLGADAEAPRPDGAAFKLVAPATQPADPTTLWSAAEDGQEAELAATATPPWEPFAFRIGGAGGKLEGTVFNCVVVLREPQERIGAAQTQPATRPATLPISEP